jgi:3-deoxy-D-manno-octulosonate 8-phosphate phosphatase (KDO 8-P phosphatase)
VRAADLLARARAVRLMVFDVDGVMTDGALWYGPRGEVLKRFHAHDGHGVKLLAAAGVPCAILSGRRSKAVAKRAAELGIKHVFQGVDDKLLEFMKFSKKRKIPVSHIGYMGDELVDLPVLECCGFSCAPREAPVAVRRRVHYVAKAPAGGGAVREVCELILGARA